MLTERIGKVLLVIAIAFLGAVAGAWLVLADTAPGHYMSDAYRAGTALWAQKTHYLNRYTDTDQWRAARTAHRGVTTYDPGAAFDGYTLYTSGDGAHALLVDMHGKVVYEWRRPFSTVWDHSAAVKTPQPDDLIYMRKARMFPNGDLLAIYIAAGDTPWGYGMVMLDRDSRVKWRYLQHTHHDFDVGPDGRVYALIHDFSFTKPEGLGFLDEPYLEDYLAILSPDGKEQKRISLLRAMAASPYRRLLYTIPRFASADPLHTNAVQLIDTRLAAHFPFARPGQLLVSLRTLGTVVVLDPQSGRVVWAMRGSWLGQHDPKLLPDGHILMFDNAGNMGGAGISRVLEVDPRTQAIVWSYRGDAAHPLASEIRGAVEREPNGDTLITESDGGRLLEVTPQGRTVWEYINPVRGGPGQGRIPVVSWGQRIPRTALAPAFARLLEHSKEE